MLENSLIGEEDDLVGSYPWVQSDDEVISKIYTLYVERTSTCYQLDSTQKWMKEVLGFLMNSIENEDINRAYWVVNAISLIKHSPIKWE